MSGIMFGGDSPMMTGTWYNPSTGDSFTVRDTFFEDNQFVIQTMDGRVLYYDQIQHYVQTDGPIPKVENKPKQETLPAEVMNILAQDDEEYVDILPEDAAMISGLGNMHMAPSMPPITQDTIYNPLPVNPNTTIIEKALSKRSLPDIQVKIDWKDFPKDEIKMLMDLMDLTKDEIVDWYVSQLDVATIMECLKQTVSSYANKQLAEPKPIKKEDEPKSTTPKKMGGPKAPKTTKSRTKK